MANIDDKFKTSYVKFKLSNVPVRYAHLQTPDTAFGDCKFHLQALCDDGTAGNLEKMGFVLKEKKDKEGNVTKNILNPKKNGRKKDGTPNEPPSVVGLDGRTPFTDELGNGSVCNLLLSAKAWQVKGTWVLSCYIESVQVVKHVPRSGGFDDLSEGSNF